MFCMNVTLVIELGRVGFDPCTRSPIILLNVHVTGYVTVTCVESSTVPPLEIVVFPRSIFKTQFAFGVIVHSTVPVLVGAVVANAQFVNPALVK